jgi:hypothetical protein
VICWLTMADESIGACAVYVRLYAQRHKVTMSQHADLRSAGTQIESHQKMIVILSFIGSKLSS